MLTLLIYLSINLTIFGSSKMLNMIIFGSSKMLNMITLSTWSVPEIDLSMTLKVIEKS